MLKPLLILNWTLLVATFLSAEFFSINQNYRWAGLIFVFWFLVTELWQVHSLAKGKPGGTFSESVGAFAASGVAWARVSMVWFFCCAMVLRLLTISAEISGHVIQGSLPIFLDEGPIWLVCFGILVWLYPHFLHLSTEYSNETDSTDRYSSDLHRL